MKHAPVGVPAHVPLVHLIRDGFVEGVHHGSVVVLAPDGSVVFRAGDAGTAFFPRSTAKLMQAVAMTRLGLSLPPDLLALSAASHSGEPFHLDAAQRILDGSGGTEDDLGNPADRPFDPVEAAGWIAAGRPARRLAHNCSGKHAAMLATARHRGWATTGYLDPGHPLQRAIRATVEDLTGEQVAYTAVDGCGSPLFAVSLAALTRAAGRIAAAAGETAEGRVARAVRAHPEMVAGTRRDVTALMRAVPGLIAKDGFEAVQVAALPDGTAIGVKIADGSDRARLPATVAALALAGVDPDLLAPFREAGTARGLAVAGELHDILSTTTDEDTTVTTRTEHDLLGDKDVPADAYWGVHTARARENFPITGVPIAVYPHLVVALASVKAAAARANAELGLLPPQIADGDRRGLRRDPGRDAARPVRRRHHPGRRRHVDEHERQRGDRQPGAGAARARQGRLRAPAPERARQPRASPPTTPTPPPSTSRRSRRCGNSRRR